MLGRLGDMFGKRLILLVSLLLSGTGGAVAAVAPDIWICRGGPHGAGAPAAAGRDSSPRPTTAVVAAAMAIAEAVAAAASRPNAGRGHWA